MSSRVIHTVYKRKLSQSTGAAVAAASMESVEHSLSLANGRTLAYHTFGEKPQNGSHPVLYFHGLPGCGLEAGIACAPAIDRMGGRVYAIDRPGMGKTSSPYGTTAEDSKSAESTCSTNSENETNAGNSSRADKNLETLMGNVWELVDDKGWEEFSVIGVSGGGPFALALLASYLRRRNPNNGDHPSRLRNVCLAGAVCFSAGTDGMKEELARLAELVEKAQTSKLYRFQLGAMSASMGPAYNYLLPALPLSWARYLISYSNQSSPSADREWLSEDDNIFPFLDMTRSMAAQGGYPGIYDDAMISLRAGQPHEDFLRKLYGGATTNDDDLPAIGIFQGGSDVNVPPSHARHLHESIFHERSRIFLYEELGHHSMVMGKVEECAAFATAARKT